MVFSRHEPEKFGHNSLTGRAGLRQYLSWQCPSNVADPEMLKRRHKTTYQPRRHLSQKHNKLYAFYKEKIGLFKKF